MSEEIENAAVIVPRAIITSIVINGALGFGMLIVTLFSLTDVEGALKSPTGFPFMQIFLNSTGSVAGATVMASILVVMQYAANVGLLAAASRMLWSFARDRGLPGWKFLMHVSKNTYRTVPSSNTISLIGAMLIRAYLKVEPRTALPIRSILITTIISLLLSLIILGSTTAFNDLVSLSVSSLQSSYLVAIGLLLYRRLTGGIHPRKSATDDVVSWGPWHMHGIWGIAVNTWACLYLIIMVFFSFWPTERAVTASTMNYAVLITGAIVIISLTYYQVWAKRVYTGPVIEISIE